MPHNGAYRLRQALSKSDSGRAGTETGGIRKGPMRQNWADFILKQRKEQGIFNVVSETLGAHSLLLLAHEVSPADLPEEMQNLIAAFQGSVTRYTLVLNYHNYSYKEVLIRLLPSTITVPSGYEIVGHIAHFNLLDQHWPHRFLIGEVCLDKCPCIKTVVAKLGAVSNKFRTFDMEVIAAQPLTQVTLKEHGLQLQFDFQKARPCHKSQESHHISYFSGMVIHQDLASQPNCDQIPKLTRGFCYSMCWESRAAVERAPRSSQPPVYFTLYEHK